MIRANIALFTDLRSIVEVRRGEAGRRLPGRECSKGLSYVRGNGRRGNVKLEGGFMEEQYRKAFEMMRNRGRDRRAFTVLFVLSGLLTLLSSMAVAHTG